MSRVEREDIARRLYDETRDAVHRRTDAMFAVLFVIQFIGAVVVSFWLSPRTWAGAASSVHIHVWAGIALSALLCGMPLVLIAFRRGHAVTRYTIAVAQMLFSALLIHLTGGRIETHFHVFGSLAFLAFYRDWRLLVPATAVIGADHFIRGLFWPESVFGLLFASPWRAIEHAGWVIFEDVFLVVSCVQARREMKQNAAARADVALSYERTEHEVQNRTRELEESKAELSVSEERLRLAVQGSQDGLWDWDLVTNLVYYAPRWKELLGCKPEDVGDRPQEWLGRISSEHLSRFDGALAQLRGGQTDELDTEIKMSHASGGSVWMLCRAISVRDEWGRVVRLVGSISDITELKEAQERLEKLAHQDSLTGLPNRVTFTERMDRELERTREEPGYRFAVLYGDFDRFKIINDSLGHSVGDALLMSIAERFRRVLREGDTVARFGGDEFVVLLPDVKSLAEVEKAAERIVDVFSEPHELDDHEIESSVSLGVVLSGSEGETADDLLCSADAAMYQAKTAGRGRYQVFDEAMHRDSLKQIDIEQALKAATRSFEAMDEQFAMHYQPIVDLSTGEIAGFEALLRWDRPSIGAVRPDVFIPIAEETGAIIAIGEWTLHRACAQLERWHGIFGTSRELTMHINLSRRQIGHPGLIASIERALDATGISPKYVKLEITETSLMDERFDAMPVLEQIRGLGIALAMDDFGTGHSSLSCLRQFPISTLKVDRVFLWNMTKHREFSAVMHAIITLAQNLNLSVVAEGIEDEEQLKLLLAMDCTYAQGFYFSRPLPAEDAERLLRNGFAIGEQKLAA